MDDEKEKDEPQVQAEDNSIAVGRINIGGDLSGTITIGHGFTAEQVSVLLKQITTTLQLKPFDGRCPYKGLDVFEEEDAELFFGRERLVEDLISRVKESRTVFITGPSGSGKSSLVRAGLIYALRQGAIKNLHSERWLYETMKPGREPLKDLALAFSRLKSPELSNYFLAHQNEIKILNECAESVLSGRKDQRFVLFIDQFEEVFAQVNQDEERLAFLNMLAHAATVENGRVIVLFAMRSDFVSNCATYPMLNEMLSQEFRQIGAMQPEELVSAIALPARHVGLPIEDELIARIINDMKGEPGALPLMQFALKDLFDSQQEKGSIIALTLEDYLRHGGIHKSLERHADNSFAKLSEIEQGLARSIFSGLIEIGRGTQDTRRTALFDELIPANVKETDVEDVVQKLADARLIITDEQAGKDTVTISHEKLIDAWPWLKKLVNENRDAIARQNEIASDAKEWNDHERDVSYLYMGARLANAREQLEANKLLLSGLSQSFIEAGVKAHTDELDAANQRAIQLRRRSVYLTVALVAALIAVGGAVFFGFQSRQQAKIVLARQLAAQAQSVNAIRNSKQMQAVLLATQSMKMFPSLEGTQVLINDNFTARPIARVTHDNWVESVAFSPDGKYVVSGSWDNTVGVWETVSGKEIVRMTHDDWVSSVAFSSDGKYVVSGSLDHTARVWETTTGNEISRVIHENQVTSVAFSPDGKYVVSAGFDGIVSVWETTTGKEVSRITEDSGVYYNCVTFSPNGKYILSGTLGGTAHVWEAMTGKEIARIIHDDAVGVVAFSPNNKYVATGGWDNTILVWEATTGKEVTRVPLDNLLRTVAFSPDSHFVATGGWDNTAHVWEIMTGREAAHMNHDGSVESIAFSPDGKYVVSGSDDYTARVWEITTGKEVSRMTHDGSVDSVAFSPDGNYVVSGSEDNTARVWEAVKGQTVVRLRHNASVISLAFSSSGDHVVSGSDDNTVSLWESSTGKEIARMTHDDWVNSVAFSPDGKYIVSGSDDGTARVWEATTGKEVARMTHDDLVNSVAFSPDNKYLVSGSDDYTARVWESSTGKEITRMTRDTWINYVVFSPDGKSVVAWGCDKWDSQFFCEQGSTYVWEALTGKEIFHVLQDDDVPSVAFSPDGKYLVAAGFDGTVRMWETSTGKEVNRMHHDGGVWSVAFSLDGKYLVSGGTDDTVRVWEVISGKETIHMTHDDSVYSVAFAPDGKHIVSSGFDNTVRIWDVASGKEVARMTYYDWMNFVAFSPDGKHVMSGSGDTIVHLWMWQPDDLIASACLNLPRNLTRVEWKQYYIDDALPYQAVCANLPIESETAPTLSSTPTP